jgi:hypothetical protein
MYWCNLLVKDKLKIYIKLNPNVFVTITCSRLLKYIRMVLDKFLQKRREGSTPLYNFLPEPKI